MHHRTMHTLLLLPALGLFRTANGNKIHRRQTSTSSSPTVPSPAGAPSPPRVTPSTNLLSDHILSVCKPNIAVYMWGTDQQKIDAGLAQSSNIEEVALTLEQSAYPCEKQEWLWYFCIDREGLPGQASREDIETERKCLCSDKSEAKGFGEWFAIEQACLSCEASNGYGESSKYIQWHREASKWTEPRFCNATTPEVNYFSLVTGGEVEDVKGEKPERPEEELKADGEMTIKSPSVVGNGGKNGEGGGEDGMDMATSGVAAESEEAMGNGRRLSVGGGMVGIMAVLGANLLL